MQDISYSKEAIKSLRRMPANQSQLIRGKIAQLARDPESLTANVSRLQGRPGYRLRVGSWRVIFDDDGSVLAILDIGPRGGIYG